MDNDGERLNQAARDAIANAGRVVSRDSAAPSPTPLVRTFTMYRRNVPDATHNELQKNAADLPQFEGIVFSDGTVAIRWLTAKRSTAVWASMEDMLAIHGHPEYGSELVWHDTMRAAEIMNLKHAIRWACGEVPDGNDLWFGEAEPDLKPGQRPRPYWWRSHMRKVAGIDNQ